MNDPTSLRLLAALGLAGAVSVGFAARPQPEVRTVTAPGQCRLVVQPTHVELRLVAQGRGEIAVDALASFEEARRRALAGYEALGVEGLTVEPLGHQVAYGPPLEDDPNMGRMYNGWPEPLEGTQYWEVLRVVVAGIDALDDAGRAALGAQLVDTAVDAGLDILGGGTTPRNYQPRPSFDYGGDRPLRWYVPDRMTLEASARASALGDARRQAEEIAAAAGATLGPVQAVKLSRASVQHTYRQPANYYGHPQPGLLHEEVPFAGVLQVDAEVTFALE